MIIKQDRSVIPACDCSFEKYKRLVKATGDLEGIGAYKLGIGFLAKGLEEAVKVARGSTDKPLIYDHQKAGTDIHESTPQLFMDQMVQAGINAVILFPQAGPVTQYEWTKAAQERNLGVIVGGEMTHPRYLEGDTSNSKTTDYTEIFERLNFDRALTGYLRKDAPAFMYLLAERMGVRDFVVPGNKAERVQHYRELLEIDVKTGLTFYSPGLITQGGSMSDAAKAAGKSWHAIVGRALFEAENMREAAIQQTKELVTTQ